MNNLTNLFNSPMEAGLRSLIILEAGYPHSYDIARLVIYDYLLVHSGDIRGGPDSIHPDTPHRSGEMLIKRPVLESGIKNMMAKGLIKSNYSEHGITYVATEASSPFLDSLQADYTRRLMVIADWVTTNFDEVSVDELNSYANRHLGVWGGEFINESIVRGDVFS
ncbi:ABC-three component system middle component 2 [Oceanimonas doudoroffii]|uniref:ABC-three component system middle component 2 n=1 Tax=Oceanimonas doudoroffii TaxID=84158 RepID=UPI0011406812|nr:ABC-three component system middle component 2 [Oceanimonas doudoroffii]